MQRPQLGASALHRPPASDATGGDVVRDDHLRQHRCEGARDAKTKQIVAVTVALAAQCPYCSEIHTQAARKQGASDAELGEAAMVAAAIGAGSAVTHATHLFAK